MKNFIFFAILVFFNSPQIYSQTTTDSSDQVVQVRKVATIPFSNMGDDDYNWVSRGLVYLINNKIAVINGLYATDDRTITKSLQEISFKGGILSDRLSSQFGKITNADVIVSGSFTDEKKRLSIQTVYHNATNGQKIYEEGMIASPKAISKVADKIIIKLTQLLGLDSYNTTSLLKNTNLTNNNDAFESFIKAYQEIEKTPPDTDAAIDLFEDAIEDDAEFWEAYYNLGVLYFNDNKYNKALELFNKLISATPNFYKSYFGRGLILENQNNYVAAMNDFNRVISLNPNDFLAYLHLAKVNRHLKNFKEAKNNLNKAKALSADYAPIYYETGNLLVDQGKPNVAIDQYRKAIDLNPDNMLYHQGLGEAYYKARVYYNALYEFKTILKENPNDANANFMLGITIYKQAVLEEIIDAFLDILNETGEPTETTPSKFKRKLESDSLKQQAIYKQMADAFSKAAAGRPDFAQAKFNLALTYLEMGAYKESEKYFLETQEIAPNLIQAYTKLAEVYEKTKRRPLAINQYKNAFYVEPSIYMRKPTLDVVHQYVNVLDRFMADLQRRLDSNPDDLEANLTMAKVNIENENCSAAKTRLEKILRLQPGNIEARKLMDSLKK